MNELGKAKRTVEHVWRLLAERDILNTEMTVDEVVEKWWGFHNPEMRVKLTKVVSEFRKNGKVDWKIKIEN